MVFNALKKAENRCALPQFSPIENTSGGGLIERTETPCVSYFWPLLLPFPLRWLLQTRRHLVSPVPRLRCDFEPGFVTALLWPDGLSLSLSLSCVSLLLCVVSGIMPKPQVARQRSGLRLPLVPMRFGRGGRGKNGQGGDIPALFSICQL
jgi:hypothetical protein